MDGLLLIDKPSGITSHDVVDRVRRRFKVRKVGHAGTLDPMATGLLILLVGAATRRAQEFLQCDKSYLAAVRLGKTTDTQDAEGKILTEQEVGPLTGDEIEEACRRFRGEIEQEIPAYSAVRIQGRRSYALARAGLEVPRRSRRIRIDELTILAVRLPEVELKVTCSSGTYIRALASGLGEVLGCGAHLARLRRIRVGSFTIDQAVKLDEVEPRHLLAV
ncbi:MAG: tRNA pseudouridine(55) synthase TruB [Candidatus Omnitrophica bacterium]|nr:tRNA pseudouridine(55) synthase TruB [Candidatus Omnitrophota bacterium]